MSRIGLSWRGALQNTSQFGVWYGNRTYQGHNIHAEITMNPKGHYRWEVLIYARTIQTGTETAGSGGLTAAKEAISIIVSDYFGK